MRACRNAAHISCPCCLWLLGNGARQSSLSHAELGLSLCSVGSNWSCFLPIHGPTGIIQNNKQWFAFLFPAWELCILIYDINWLPSHKSITNSEQCLPGPSLPHWWLRQDGRPQDARKGGLLAPWLRTTENHQPCPPGWIQKGGRGGEGRGLAKLM